MSVARQGNVQLNDLDRPTIAIYIALVLIGWLMIFAVNYNPNDFWAFMSLGHNAGKQLFFIVVCSALLFVILLTDWTFWRVFGFVIYLASILLLIGPIFLGREINGARAWYQLGGFSFQPSEIAKFGACLAMASYLSATGVTLRQWRTRLIAAGIFLLPVLIILLEKDTGSALVFFSFLLVLYREGLPAQWYVLGLGSAALVILGLAFNPLYVIAALILLVGAWLIAQLRENRWWWLVWLLTALLTIWWDALADGLLRQLQIPSGIIQNWPWLRLAPATILGISAGSINYAPKNVLTRQRLQWVLIGLILAVSLVQVANFACYTLLAPHQQQRIKVWLQPANNADTRGSAYNLLHSKMAIGSGGFSGKGFLDGNMTKLKYVPEQSTDFIFCTVGEEQGFIGVVGVVVLYVLLLYRITLLAERQRSNFSRIYAYGVAGILFAHFIVNIGMTMGLFPIIGIPLPMLSYGGSSLIGFTLMIGVLLKLDNHRNQA
jgi:rod shape determining protein RodA